MNPVEYEDAGPEPDRPTPPDDPEADGPASPDDTHGDDVPKTG